MKLCQGCGQPTGRANQARWCLPCKGALNRQRGRVWAASARGRALRHQYAISPARKIQRARYDDAHPLQTKVYAARYRTKHSTIGTWIRCAHPDCRDGFLRTVKNGSQRYCPADARLSRQMSNAESNRRYWRRKRLASAA